MINTKNHQLLHTKSPLLYCHLRCMWVCGVGVLLTLKPPEVGMHHLCTIASSLHETDEPWAQSSVRLHHQ